MSDIPEHLMNTTCPNCGYIHDRASMAYDYAAQQVPQDDDASMCIGCGTISIFDGDALGGLRKPTEREQRQLDSDPEIRRLKRAWRAVRERTPWP